jgi:hypothetical protein
VSLVRDIAGDLLAAILNCALKAEDLELGYATMVREAAEANRQAVKAARDGAQKVEQEKAKRDLQERLWQQIEPGCRDGDGEERHILCELDPGKPELVPLLTLEVAQIRLIMKRKP